MAINQKIIQKISEKTCSDKELKENLEKVLSGIEEGRQGKRIIENIMKIISL